MSKDILNQFVFEKMEDGYALKKYIGKEEKVVVPDTFQGEPVVLIKESAFWECNSIQELTLPASLKKAEVHGIGPCRSLRKVTCHSENAQFDEWNFYICHEIEEMSLSVWVQGHLFFDVNQKILLNFQNNWATMNLNDKKKIIDCVSMDISMKETIFVNGEASLISFLLREGVLLTLDELNDYLEASVAENNTLVTACFLHYKGENYTTQEIEAYEEHRQLVEIGLELSNFGEFHRKWMINELEEGLEIIRYIGEKSETIMPSSLTDGRRILGTFHRMNGAYEPLKKLVLSEGIRYLDKETFCRSKTLEEVILPESLESMGIGCFQFCDSLKTIHIPDNIKEIPKDCFSDCTALENVSLSEGLCSIDDYAFADCKNLKEITLPQSLKELKQGVKHSVGPLQSSDDYGIFFRSGIQSITIPPQVKKIPNFAFYGCSDLKEVNLHENITDIGKGAFKYAPLLADENGFVIINNIFFDFTKANTVCVVPAHVKRISCKAFIEAKFQEIILPDGLLEIDERGFWDCSNLKKITIPSSVKVLVQDAFTECKNLEEVVVSSGTRVEDGALKDCPFGKIVVKAIPHNSHF
ncbi:MAG: leucine-rich repeat protein [Eubacteriales bacterium]